jgi:hypothetical protein
MKPLIAEVEDSFKHPSDALPVSSIRFFAHLWLFLNMINAANDLTQSTLIIEKYIEILQVSCFYHVYGLPRHQGDLSYTDGGISIQVIGI